MGNKTFSTGEREGFPRADSTSTSTSGTVRDLDFDFESIRRAVKGLRFGEVRVIIQDGVIVQIERVEKQRLR